MVEEKEEEGEEEDGNAVEAGGVKNGAVLVMVNSLLGVYTNAKKTQMIVVKMISLYSIYFLIQVRPSFIGAHCCSSPDGMVLGLLIAHKVDHRLQRVC